MGPLELSAAQLAERTGVPAGTLRVWQTRHGFPAATASSGQRRRYREADVDRIKAVLEHRRSGLSLAAAIARAQTTGGERPVSMFAALREARPDLPVRVYPKPLVLALSRALEDEQAARAAGGILLGSFQRERHYRASEARWRALARRAALTVVLADFPALADDGSGPVEVPLDAAHPLEREWTVLICAPTAAACLAAWEVPSAAPLPDAERRFELIWSCDPAAAHHALAAGARVLGRQAPAVGARIPPALLATPTPTASHQRFADDLNARAFAYLSVAAARTGMAVLGP